MLYALLDQVVDDYAPVVAGLENDIDEIEDQLFSGDPAVSRRIYELAREVIQFQRAIHPLPAMMQQLRRGFDEISPWTPSCSTTCGTSRTTWSG